VLRRVTRSRARRRQHYRRRRPVLATGGSAGRRSPQRSGRFPAARSGQPGFGPRPVRRLSGKEKSLQIGRQRTPLDSVQRKPGEYRRPHHRTDHGPIRSETPAGRSRREPKGALGRTLRDAGRCRPLDDPEPEQGLPGHPGHCRGPDTTDNPFPRLSEALRSRARTQLPRRHIPKYRRRTDVENRFRGSVCHLRPGKSARSSNRLRRDHPSPLPRQSRFTRPAGEPGWRRLLDNDESGSDATGHQCYRPRPR